MMAWEELMGDGAQTECEGRPARSRSHVYVPLPARIFESSPPCRAMRQNQLLQANVSAAGTASSPVKEDAPRRLLFRAVSHVLATAAPAHVRACEKRNLVPPQINSKRGAVACSFTPLHFCSDHATVTPFVDNGLVTQTHTH